MAKPTVRWGRIHPSLGNLRQRAEHVWFVKTSRGCLMVNAALGEENVVVNLLQTDRLQLEDLHEPFPGLLKEDL